MLKIKTFWRKFKILVENTIEKVNKETVKRKRKIDFKYILAFLMIYSCNKNITINEAIQKIYEYGFPKVRKSSLYEARTKYSYDTLVKLHKDTVNIIDQTTHKSKQSKRFFAIDGSKVLIPNFKQSKKHYVNYGTHFNHGMLSCMYDIVYQIPYDFIFSENTAERLHAEEHLKMCRSGDVIIFDRGYISRRLIQLMNSRNIDFIFRIPKRDRQFFTIFSDEKCFIDKNIEYNFPDGTNLKLRLIKYKGIHCVTSLRNRKKYPSKFISDKYKQRWNIEEFYKTLKMQTTMGDFHGNNEHSVMQEIASQFIMLTLSKIQILQCLQLVKKNIFVEYPYQSVNNIEKINCKYNYRINSFAALKNIKDNILNLFRKPLKKISKVFKKSIICLKDYLIAIRKNRIFARLSRRPINKWKKNKKSKLIPPNKV